MMLLSTVDKWQMTMLMQFNWNSQGLRFPKCVGWSGQCKQRLSQTLLGHPWSLTGAHESKNLLLLIWCQHWSLPPGKTTCNWDLFFSSTLFFKVDSLLLHSASRHAQVWCALQRGSSFLCNGSPSCIGNLPGGKQTAGKCLECHLTFQPNLEEKVFPKSPPSPAGGHDLAAHNKQEQSVAASPSLSRVAPALFPPNFQNPVCLRSEIVGKQVQVGTACKAPPGVTGKRRSSSPRRLRTSVCEPSCHQSSGRVNCFHFWRLFVLSEILACFVDEALLQWLHKMYSTTTYPFSQLNTMKNVEGSHNLILK